MMKLYLFYLKRICIGHNSTSKIGGKNSWDEIVCIQYFGLPNHDSLFKIGTESFTFLTYTVRIIPHPLRVNLTTSIIKIVKYEKKCIYYVKLRILLRDSTHCIHGHGNKISVPLVRRY